MWFLHYNMLLLDYVKRKKPIEANSTALQSAYNSKAWSTHWGCLKLLLFIAGLPALDRAGRNLIPQLQIKPPIARMPFPLPNPDWAALSRPDIVRGLTGTLRGDDQQMYFDAGLDMRQIWWEEFEERSRQTPKADGIFPDTLFQPANLCSRHGREVISSLGLSFWREYRELPP